MTSPGTLAFGLFVLLALLIAAGTAASVGPAELAIWVVLVVAWVVTWVRLRRKARTRA